MTAELVAYASSVVVEAQPRLPRTATWCAAASASERDYRVIGPFNDSVNRGAAPETTRFLAGLRCGGGLAGDGGAFAREGGSLVTSRYGFSRNRKTLYDP